MSKRLLSDSTLLVTKVAYFFVPNERSKMQRVVPVVIDDCEYMAEHQDRINLLE